MTDPHIVIYWASTGLWEIIFSREAHWFRSQGLNLKVTQNKGYVPMPSGKVKWFDPKKGYGFILHETGEDAFVPYTSIVGARRWAASRDRPRACGRNGVIFAGIAGNRARSRKARTCAWSARTAIQEMLTIRRKNGRGRCVNGGAKPWRGSGGGIP